MCLEIKKKKKKLFKDTNQLHFAEKMEIEIRGTLHLFKMTIKGN